jgi:uncharacterized protein (DUF488 family)
MTVWTIGHGTRPADELVGLLTAHGIAVLADVRTVPRSRRNPQFNRETLPGTLAAAGLQYVHLPQLGGLRRARPDSVNTAWRNASFRGYADYMLTEAFAAGVDELLRLAAHAPTAIMCAETIPWRCHRSLIADALLVRGVEVRHLGAGAAIDSHRLTPFARVEHGRITYPAAQRELGA